MFNNLILQRLENLKINYCPTLFDVYMRDLHTRLAEVSRKYGRDRGDDIQVTGARHRSTAEYNRDLHRENAMLETLIDDNREQLNQLDDQIKKAKHE